MNEEIFLKKIGERIYNHRATLGITINELSSKTGINPENIAAIEMGKMQLGLEEFLEITRAIGIDPSKIIENILKKR